MNRRQLLACAGGASAVATFMPRTAAAPPAVGKIHTVKYWIKNNDGHDIDRRFNAQHRWVLEVAIDRVHRRLLQPYFDPDHQMDNAFYRDAVDLFGGSHEDYRNYRNTKDYPKALLARMRYYFGNFDTSLGLKFPKIVIHYVYEPEQRFLAQARVGIMRMHDAGEYTRIYKNAFDGVFEMDVNAYFINNIKEGVHTFSLDHWCGTIAHEMLHNLGFKHPPQIDDPTYFKHQMVMWASAITEDKAVPLGYNPRCPILCRPKQ